MKQRAETKAYIEKKIDQCNRRLGLIQIVSNELKAVRADLGNWEQNLSATEQDRLAGAPDRPGGRKEPRVPCLVGERIWEDRSNAD